MAKKNRISVNNAGGIFFFVLTAALAYSGIALASDAVEYTISYGGAVFFTFCTVINGKWYTLKETGIQHRFFGICYRFTPWSEIKDVMFAKTIDYKCVTTMRLEDEAHEYTYIKVNNPLHV
jgi:hypothetical protein